MEIPLSRYAEKWKNLIEREKKKSEELSEKALEEARRIADVLGSRFNPIRIILFGSLSKGKFRSGSDIDLAIEGLDPGLFFKAVAATLDSRFKIDIKPLEDIDETLRSKVRKEGLILYER